MEGFDVLVVSSDGWNFPDGGKTKRTVWIVRT